MRFSKMHGAGNSFVVTENLHQELQGEDLQLLALRLCREQETDGMIVLVPAAEETADFGMLFYNSDGSLGEMCGNGSRCAARYGYEHGFAKDPGHIRILATAGLVLARRLSEELYEVHLNDPSVLDLHRPVELGGERYDCAYVELGRPGLPHAVLEVEEAAFSDQDALRALGRELRHAPVFPKGANVSFVCPTGENRVRAITFERGVEDFTLACGTGCGSLALSLVRRGRLPGPRVEIDMPGGRLSVLVTEENGLYLTGPTKIVFW